MQIETTKLKNLLLSVSKDALRYNLNAICLKKETKRAWATCGHQAYWVDFDFELSKDYVLCSKSIERALKIFELDQKSKGKLHKQNFVEFTFEGEKVFLETHEIEVLNADFPKVEQVIPDTKNPIKVILSQVLLDTVVKQLKNDKTKRVSGIQFELDPKHINENGIYEQGIKFETMQGNGVLMPMRNL